MGGPRHRRLVAGMVSARVARILPGLLLVLALSAFAFYAARFAITVGVGAVALGILVGLIVGNLRPPGPLLEPGVSFAAKRILALAVVLLGLRVTFEEITAIGTPLFIAVGVVFGTLAISLLLGKAFAVSPRFSALIGAGTGVCGVAAIAATRSVVGGSRSETIYATATVTLLGTIGLIVFPLVQLTWHPLDPQAFGVLAGAGLHSVPQAVGAGFAGGGEQAGVLATIVKLTRVALLGPLVFLLIVLWRTVGRHPGKSGFRGIPVEVWGFLAAMLLGNLLPVPAGLREAAMALSGVLLVVALTALGLSTAFRNLFETGWRPMLLAGAVWATVVAALVAVLAGLSRI